MEVIDYSSHVRVSFLVWGNSRGLERGKASWSRPSMPPGLELPGPAKVCTPNYDRFRFLTPIKGLENAS
jgi:hypothetical protein